MNFAKASLRTAVGFFLALLALVLVIAGGFWGVDQYEKSQARPYEKIRTWPADMSEALSMKLQIKTKLVDSKLLGAVEITGFPAYLNAPSNRDAKLTLNFLDEDGFNIFTKPVAFSEFTANVDTSGKRIGLEHQFDEYLSVDTYKRFSQMSISWTLDTKAGAPRPPAAAAAPEPKADLDHCAPKLSKAERLQRLANLGTVRETGLGRYSAGEGSLAFFEDGSLLSCR